MEVSRESVVAGYPEVRWLLEERHAVVWYWSVGDFEPGGDEDLSSRHVGACTGKGALALQQSELNPSVVRLFGATDGFSICAAQLACAPEFDGTLG